MPRRYCGNRDEGLRYLDNNLKKKLKDPNMVVQFKETVEICDKREEVVHTKIPQTQIVEDIFFSLQDYSTETCMFLLDECLPSDLSTLIYKTNVYEEDKEELYKKDEELDKEG